MQTPEEHAVTQSAIDKALRFSEARFRRLFETAQDGILLINAETGIIEEVNPFLMWPIKPVTIP